MGGIIGLVNRYELIVSVKVSFQQVTIKKPATLNQCFLVGSGGGEKWGKRW